MSHRKKMSVFRELIDDHQDGIVILRPRKPFNEIQANHVPDTSWNG
jgi:hypothetical protein